MKRRSGNKNRGNLLTTVLVLLKEKLSYILFKIFMWLGKIIFAICYIISCFEHQLQQSTSWASREHSIHLHRRNSFLPILRILHKCNIRAWFVRELAVCTSSKSRRACFRRHLRSRFRSSSTTSSHRERTDTFYFLIL